uniref:Uncharacterized protein n=1 Tax=Anguilla anguilla TaxID=7936 RepID=A0A0E9T516_ANGAN
MKLWLTTSSPRNSVTISSWSAFDGNRLESEGRRLGERGGVGSSSNFFQMSSLGAGG